MAAEWGGGDDGRESEWVNPGGKLSRMSEDVTGMRPSTCQRRMRGFVFLGNRSTDVFFVSI